MLLVVLVAEAAPVKVNPPTNLMDVKSVYGDQNCFFYQAVKIFVSAVKLDIVAQVQWMFTCFWNQPLLVTCGTTAITT